MTYRSHCDGRRAMRERVRMRQYRRLKIGRYAPPRPRIVVDRVNRCVWVNEAGMAALKRVVPPAIDEPPGLAAAALAGWPVYLSPVL